jgi:hypothetical protein
VPEIPHPVPQIVEAGADGGDGGVALGRQPAHDDAARRAHAEVGPVGGVDLELRVTGLDGLRDLERLPGRHATQGQDYRTGFGEPLYDGLDRRSGVAQTGHGR